MKQRVSFLAVAALFFVAANHAGSQELGVIPSFGASVVVRQQSGNLVAASTRGSDGFTMRVRAAQGKEADDGWGGVCVEARKPVDLRGFSVVRAMIRSSARVLMDIKFEKDDYTQGTVLLANHDPITRGEKQVEWNLKTTRRKEIGPSTLAETIRMCFFVLADEFPGGNVSVTVSKIRFDR